MKRLMALVGVGLVLLLVAACDTEQPTSQGPRTATVRFLSFASVPGYCDLWDRYVDSNANQIVDPGEPFDGIECGFCYDLAEPEIAAVPARFSVEVSVIRAGTTVKTVLTPASAISGFTSISDDDGREIPLGTPGDPPFAVAGYVYDHPRGEYYGSADTLSGCFLLPIEPNIAGEPPPFEVELVPGDTILVRAGRADTPVLDLFSQLDAFQSTLTLDGVQITPDGLSESLDAEARLSYSFTVR